MKGLLKLPRLSLILAMDRNRLIGANNLMPWHLPAEMAYFKKVTMGHPVLMGRKTYESIGRPLPGRENLILTREQGYKAEGCQIVHSVEEAINRCRNQEIMVIGGAEIYKATLSAASKLYLTIIDHEFEGDTYFPEFDEREWVITNREPGLQNEKNPYKYEFLTYERVR